MRGVKREVIDGTLPCSDCETRKPIESFYRNKKYAYGRDSICKDCKNSRYRGWVSENRDTVREYARAYKAKYPERTKESLKKWYEGNKDHAKAYSQEQYHTNPQRKLSCRLRNRLNKFLASKGLDKNGSAINDLGCTVDELKTHLESKFQPGMSWDNHGKWHIDHVEPLVSFTLQNREEFLRACHFTNLQPLWASDNLKKGSKSVVD